MLGTVLITLLFARPMSRRLNRVSTALNEIVRDDFGAAAMSAAIEELWRSAEQIAEGATWQAAAIHQATGATQRLDDGIESVSRQATSSRARRATPRMKCSAGTAR